MPKASVDKDDFSLSGEDEIGVAGEVAAVQPISEAHRMHHPTHGHLGLRVLATNKPHAVATLGWIEDVGHSTSRIPYWLGNCLLPISERRRPITKRLDVRHDFVRRRDRRVPGSRWIMGFDEITALLKVPTEYACVRLS